MNSARWPGHSARWPRQSRASSSASRRRLSESGIVPTFVVSKAIGCYLSVPAKHRAGQGIRPQRGTMSKTVMIVEDNELNMKLFNDLLESRGYSIIQTRNGMEAIGLARAHHPC